MLLRSKQLQYDSRCTRSRCYVQFFDVDLPLSELQPVKIQLSLLADVTDRDSPADAITGDKLKQGAQRLFSAE
jgi:hypothetical protein